MSIYDEREVKGYNPGAGAQQPGKYPYVGPAYQKYGEQPGWTYSPRDDKYYRDAASREQLDQYEQQQGLKEKTPKQPGLLESVAPVAGTLGAMYLGKTLGQEAIPFAKDALGLGSAATGTTAGGAASPGLLGASGNVISSTSLPSVTATGGGASTAATGGASVSGAVPAAPGGLLSGIAPMAGSASGLGALGGIAAATYLGGKSAYNMLKGKEDKSAQGYLGRGILGMATGGLSELARPFFGQKSTREKAADRTKGLLGASDDANYQSYVQGMREQYNAPPPDPTKPFAGKYASWDDYVKGGLEANNLTGVYGNIKAYGPRWANLTEQQRQAVTQENINSGLYYSDKGDVLIKDEAKALENLNKIAPETPQAAPAPTQPQRSSTLSPGIGKDGKPIRNPGLLGAR